MIDEHAEIPESVESKCTEDEAAAPERPFGSRPVQFGLRQLFGLTTFAACATVAAMLRGPGTLALSIGGLAVWTNLRGGFARWQTAQRRPGVFYLAWLILICSLFLPALKSCNGKPLLGWQAAYTCAVAEVSLLSDLANDREVKLAPLFHLGILNLSNIAMLLSPLLLWRLQRGKGQTLAASFAILAVPVWSLGVNRAYLIGYYFWAAAFILVTVTFRISWRMLAPMFVMMVVFYLSWDW